MLKENQISLVKTSFALIDTDLGYATMYLFFKNLFMANPSLESGMFAHTNQNEQSGKLLDAITEVVNNLNDLTPVVPTLKALGKKHAGFGVTSEHYDQVGEALIQALKTVLRKDFTAEVEEAWKAAYGVLSATMQEGAAE